MIIALLHTIFCQLTHRTFSQWSNVEELILLAKTSEPKIGMDEPVVSPADSSGAKSSDENDQIARVDWQREVESKAGNENQVSTNTSSNISNLSAMSLRMRIRSIPKLKTNSENDTFEDRGPSFENARRELQLLVGDDDRQTWNSIRPGVAYS